MQGAESAKLLAKVLARHLVVLQTNNAKNAMANRFTILKI